MFPPKPVPGIVPVIGFEDLIFENDLRWCKQEDGRKILKVFEVGMPRLSKQFPRSVFFLRGPSVRGGPQETTKGTGCLVARPSKTAPPKQHVYGVTCRHVVESLGTTIRVNVFDDAKPYRDISIEDKDWKTCLVEDDLAVVDLTDHLIKHEDDVGAVAEDAFVTEDFIHEVELGSGEDVFMYGFYANTESSGRNNPVTRFGNIAALATPEVPLTQGHGLSLPSHLIDMRSRTGFSGSPVFVFRTYAGDFSEPNKTGLVVGPGGKFLKLLGIHTAQFPEEITAEKAEAMGGQIKEGDKLVIPSSMTIVIPAWKISECLDDQNLEEIRLARDKKWREEIAPMSNPESAQGPSPNHKERFNRLLGEAATGKKRDKKT